MLTVLTALIEKYFESSDSKKLLEWYYNCELQLLETGEWTGELFSHVTSLLQDQRVHAAKDATPITKLVLDNWEFLTETQKTRIVGMTRTILCAFHDDTASYCVAELLGEKVGNQVALQILKDASTDPNENCRVIAACGLRRLGFDGLTKELRSEAAKRLHEMKHDPSEAVRHELQFGLDLPPDTK